MYCRVRLEPEAGGPDAVMLAVTAAGPGPWDWRPVSGNNGLRSAVRVDMPWTVLFGLAGTSPWPAIATAGTPAAGETTWWRLTFYRQLTEPVEMIIARSTQDAIVVILDEPPSAQLP